jgi:hypothetical protein
MLPKSMEASMGFFAKGQYLPLPWKDDFELFLTRMGSQTEKFSGEELLHQIHKEAIESKWINLRLHMLVRRRLPLVIAMQVAMFAYLIFR